MAGNPLAEFAYEPFAQSEIARLDELWAALEQRIEATSPPAGMPPSSVSSRRSC